MFFISLGFFCILVISKCIIAEEEETSLFPTTEFGDDAPFFSDYSSFTDPGDLEGSLGSDLIDPTFGTLNDEDDGAPVPIFADSNEICSFDTSQLIGSLSRRGVANNCDNSEGSNVLKAPTISPKVAPFIDLKTMELKKICPGRLRWPYTVAVCSSGSRGDIIMYPQDATFDLFWAQQSKWCYAFEVYEPQMLVSKIPSGRG